MLGPHAAGSQAPATGARKSFAQVERMSVELGPGRAERQDAQLPPLALLARFLAALHFSETLLLENREVPAVLQLFRALFDRVRFEP